MSTTNGPNMDNRQAIRAFLSCHNCLWRFFLSFEFVDIANKKKDSKDHD